MKEFKNILIVRTDRIGDVVLTTPAIRAVRQHFPSAKISVLIAPLTYELLNGLPFINEILIDDREGVNKSGKGFLKLVQLLKSKKFDLVINYHTKKRINLACYFARIPHRVGYKNKKFGALLNHPVEDRRHLGEKHEAEYCLDLLKEIGVESDDLTLEVAVNEESSRWMEDFFNLNNIKDNDQIVVIHPAASDPAKQWPKENFIEAMRVMSERKSNLKFLIIGTYTNRPIAQSIARGHPAAIEMAGLISLGQLVSLLKRADLLISNDSGPVHIASAVGTAVVSIFTRNQPGINPQRWQPLGENSRIVSVKFDDQISFKKAQSYDPKTMEPVTVDAVLEAVDSLSKLC